MYSVAALAAGVSMLAMAQSADAEVVITRANLPVTYLSWVTLDLNNDGTDDFRFLVPIYGDFSYSANVTVAPLTGGEVVGSPHWFGPYASALFRGAKIGPSAHFSSGVNTHSGVTIERIKGTFRGATHLYGNWKGNPHNGYLGVKFLINGETHFGWVRLSVTSTFPLNTYITGYAYETVAGKKILAGIPPKQATPEIGENQTSGPSLGMLALGTGGLPLWRRN